MSGPALPAVLAEDAAHGILTGAPTDWRISAHHAVDAGLVVEACLLLLRKQRAGLFPFSTVVAWERNFWLFLYALWSAAERPPDADLEALGAAAEVLYRLQDPAKLPSEADPHPLKELVCETMEKLSADWSGGVTDMKGRNPAVVDAMIRRALGYSRYRADRNRERSARESRWWK